MTLVKRQLSGLVLALALMLAVVPAAGASYPGSNGLLSFVIAEEDSPGFVGLYVDQPFANTPATQILGCNSSAAPCPAGDIASFSPGGSTIAFGTDDGNVGLIAPDGSNARELSIPGLFSISNPVWSPHAADWVLEGFSNSDPGGDVYAAPTTPIVGPGGGSVRQLTVRHGGDPDWSFKDRIAFEEGLNPNAPINPDNQLFAINPDGSGRQQLTRRGGADPSWSPHGAYMAFSRNNQIYTMKVPSSGSGQKATRLTGKGGSNPIWSPDGKWIAFERGNGVYVMTTKAKRLRRVAVAGDGYFFSELGWQPLP